MQASVYIGYDKKRVTLKDIYDAKSAAGVPQDSVLISVSYLGRMKKSEFVAGTE